MLERARQLSANHAGHPLCLCHPLHESQYLFLYCQVEWQLLAYQLLYPLIHLDIIPEWGGQGGGEVRVREGRREGWGSDKCDHSLCDEGDGSS